MQNGGWEDGEEPYRKSSEKLSQWQDDYGSDLASPVRSMKLDSMIFIGIFQLQIFFESFIHTHIKKVKYVCLEVRQTVHDPWNIGF